MADELSFLTINADTTSWVDDLPSAISTGYQAQNTNIEARNLGQDDTSISISGTNITLDPSGVIDDDGLPIVINSAVTLPVGSDGDWYIKVIAGSTATQRSLTLQSGGGTWETSKQGYYDTGDRILNWKITRASGVLKLFKRTKPNEGLDLNGNIEAPQADISTVNATDVNATTVSATTGDITTVNATTVGADTGNITTVNATTINATGAVAGGSFNSGDGAVTFDQETRTDSDVTFGDVGVNGSLLLRSDPTESELSSTSPNTIIIPRGVYSLKLFISTTFVINPALTAEIELQKFIDGAWEKVEELSKSAGSTGNVEKIVNFASTYVSSGADLRIVISEDTSGGTNGTYECKIIMRKY